MRRKSAFSWIIIAALFSLSLASCGYSVGGNNSSGSTLLFPADGATLQTVDVEVVAEFSGNIEVYTDWADYFTLTADGSGDNLCTSYNYDNGRYILTCLHDDLDNATTYVAVVTGILATNGAMATWETE